MLKVEFETATLVDAIGKAARFAPTKGSALDKAGGILILFCDGGLGIQVAATDLDNSFVRRVPTTAVLDTPDLGTRWRVAHNTLVAVMNGLPVESGSRVTLWAEDEQWMHIEASRIKAKLALYDKSVPYPDEFLKSFNMDEDFGDVDNFATKLAQIAWATDPKSAVLAGVHIDGEFASATDRTSMARVPLDCPVPAPVTVAIDSALQLLRDYPEIALRATEDELLVTVDEDTEVTCRLLKGGFPNAKKMLEDPINDSIVIERDHLLAALGRVSAPFTDKMPMVLIEIRPDAITLTMQSKEQGKITETIEHGQNVTDVDLWVTPGPLRSMLEGAGENRLELCYHPTGTAKPSLDFIRVQDRLGYIALTMPRKP